jgi:CDP-diacylglycerol--glycerol-3-phosphate 3-phosphatidyltransferase
VLHGGFDPRSANRLVRGWLFLSYSVSRQLARTGTRPNAVTVAGLLLSIGVPLAAWPGGAWPLLGALLILASALADTVDGALAVITGKASRLGHVFDSTADRLSEAAWAIALIFLGAPIWLAIAAGGSAWLHEYIRARAAVAGMADVGTVTIGERPTRIIVVFFTLVVAGTVSATAATVGAAIWLVLGLVALVQLGVAVRRALRGADPIGD